MNVTAILEHVAELVRNVQRLADAAERIAAAHEQANETNREYVELVRSTFNNNDEARRSRE